MLRDCFKNLHKIERKRIVMPDIVGLRLNRGERPEPLSAEIQSVVSNALARRLGSLQQYPSYSEFYQQLAQYVNFPVEQIVVGAGIEEFIRILMFLCCDPGQKAAVLWPTCAMYDIYAKAFDVNLIRIKPVPGVYFGISEFIKEIPKDTKVVFVPNPGQPVETNFNNAQLLTLAEFCHYIGATLVIDEAHWGFGASTAFPLIRRGFDNVLVMRTFSKFFGAASIRVGYTVGPTKLIKALHAVRPSGEIAGPSMAVASVLLDQTELFVNYANQVIEARDWLREEIKSLGFDAWGEAGFSLLIGYPDKESVEEVGFALAQNGVLVKYGFPKPVEKCMLLTCGTMALAKRFLSSFEKAL